MKNNKDRIICVSEAVPTKMDVQGKNKYKESNYCKTVALGKHTFYYQPANISERFYLFSTKRYSPTVATFFSEKGVLVRDDLSVQTHSITLDEFYRQKNCHHNYVLNKVFDRIPVWVNDVIRYELDAATVSPSVSREDACRSCSDSRCWDDDRVA